MTQTSSTIPRAAVVGTASGVFFMALFGTLWAYTGIMGLQGWGLPLLLVIAIIMGVSLFISGFSLIIASRQLTNQASTTDVRLGKRTRLWFNLIFAAEGIAIAIAIAICNNTESTELIPLVIAIIVGVHFFPLAPLFQVKFYYWTGALLCLLPIVIRLFVPAEFTLGEHQINAYMSITGIGSALILWATGLIIWRIGRRLVR
ncbi:hypothetical protein PALU110988_20975 [Paenibacillus lupini]|uniref:hypothetical protein n=1 Tax=Paenibacillus lupini TaxID=1450204 RepID=UPI00142471C6|nr:hypothetical protein [Paenibacillus lupini]NIK22274.1 glucan phosphoethanolaminetransferase (alkaline phosphatase superfamily) [Paenibacillus lupini]